MYDGRCTNQRTELYAILQALKYINVRLGLSKYRLFIKTDSMYSLNCITKWARGWVNNGWMTQNDKPVANKDLIKNIYKYYTKFTIFMEHVDAHTDGDDDDSIGNNIADALATRATKKAFSGKQADNAPNKSKTRKTIPHKRIQSGSKTNRTPRKISSKEY